MKDRNKDLRPDTASFVEAVRDILQDSGTEREVIC